MQLSVILIIFVLFFIFSIYGFFFARATATKRVEMQSLPSLCPTQESPSGTVRIEGFAWPLKPIDFFNEKVVQAEWQIETASAVRKVSNFSPLESGKLISEFLLVTSNGPVLVNTKNNPVTLPNLLDDFHYKDLRGLNDQELNSFFSFYKGTSLSKEELSHSYMAARLCYSKILMGEPITIVGYYEKAYSGKIICNGGCNQFIRFLNSDPLKSLIAEKLDSKDLLDKKLSYRAKLIEQARLVSTPDREESVECFGRMRVKEDEKLSIYRSHGTFLGYELEQARRQYMLFGYLFIALLGVTFLIYLLK